MKASGEKEEQLEKFRWLCRESLKFLCMNVLGYKDWDLIHDDMERFLMKPARRKLMLVPRGHLKTAIVTKAYAIQRILVNPNVRVLIANQVWDKAREMLDEIKVQLTKTSALPAAFGVFESDRWNKDEIVVKQRTKALSAPTVGTTGVEAEMTSTHYDVIIADDLQGLQNTATPEQRTKVKRFYRSLIALLEPGGLLIVVGTRWHMDDLYAEILESERVFFDVMVRKVVEGGRLIFPKKFNLKFDAARRDWRQAEVETLDYIDYLKATYKPSEFSAQFMNEPVSDEDQLFKPGYFKYWDRREEDLFVVLTLDPAIGLKKESDYTAFLAQGMNERGDIFVLDYLRGHWTPAEAIENLFQMEEKWKPNVAGIECQGFQRTYKYAAEAEMRRRRHYFPVTEIRQSTHVTKEYRIQALEPSYRAGKVFHAAWMKGKDLEWELQTFPKGKNDDLIDAMSMGLPLLMPGGRRAVEHIPPGSWEYHARGARKMLRPYDSFFHWG